MEIPHKNGKQKNLNQIKENEKERKKCPNSAADFNCLNERKMKTNTQRKDERRKCHKLLYYDSLIWDDGCASICGHT